LLLFPSSSRRNPLPPRTLQCLRSTLPGEPPEDAEEYVFLPAVCGAERARGSGVWGVVAEAARKAAPWQTARRGARRADPGRGGGRINRLRSPISPAAPPLHAANRPG
jgi:hypothetical protein